MDDTIVAFLGDERLKVVPIIPTYMNYDEMHEPGYFRDLKPLPGAIEWVKALIGSGLFEIDICSVPVHTKPSCYEEKVSWIHQHLTELSQRIMLVQDKSRIKGDYLIYDSLRWKEK